jgi:hypothetical protein
VTSENNNKVWIKDFPLLNPETFINKIMPLSFIGNASYCYTMLQCRSFMMDCQVSSIKITSCMKYQWVDTVDKLGHIFISRGSVKQLH